ncbi:MAG TPA: Ada metal-binding domain-containing protein [Kaistia sp.]|nr:Ada metal-binding domain-containing protein [Kaistia sp.]
MSTTVPFPAEARIYGVTTTGIFCRPDCPSRSPRPENVRFFADAAAAETAGLRACKRCAPGREP